MKVDVAVWGYDNGTSTPIYTTSQIAAVVNAVTDSNFTPQQIDLDAMMTKGTEIIFSVDPVGSLDGGEIFYWNSATDDSSFFSHGGHLWDTAFDVQGTFGTATENINALEAVAATPEPTSAISLLSLGIIGVGSLVRRNRQK
ncbi:MAG: PEP-CTERM sorting domain-containing protein [Microcystaceae cyanobacterium]